MLAVMEKTTLYLPADLQRSLVAMAKREGRSQADIIRAALETYLSDRGSVPLRSIGAGDDDEVTGANSEQWLRGNWKNTKAKRPKDAR
jgi:hypothetical protein